MMQKFGTVLNGRPTGREALLRLRQIINGSADKENIVLDFSGVEVLTPSYADELLKGLRDHYGKEKIEIVNALGPAAETIQAISKDT